MSMDEIYKAPGHLIRRCQQIAVGIFLEEMAPFDLTPVQYAALVAIREHPGIDQRTLVSLIAIDRSTVGHLLARLEQKKLITRVVPKTNQRVKQLFITPAGTALLRSVRETARKVQNRILAPLSKDERAAFMRCLERLVDINNSYSRVPLKIMTA